MEGCLVDRYVGWLVGWSLVLLVSWMIGWLVWCGRLG